MDNANKILDELQRQIEQDLRRLDTVIKVFLSVADKSFIDVDEKVYPSQKERN